jgi:hypothetical protein
MIFHLGSDVRRTFDLEEGLAQAIEKYQELVCLRLYNVAIPNVEVLLRLIPPILRLRKLCALGLGIKIQNTEDQSSLRRLKNFFSNLFAFQSAWQERLLLRGDMQWKIKPTGIKNLEYLCDFATTDEVLKAKYEKRHSSRIMPIAIESLNLDEMQWPY